MSLIQKASTICRQAKLIIKDYEEHGALDQEEREDAIYYTGSLSILLEIVDTIHDITITEEELNNLYNKLQEIIDRKEK